jgi:hypothetical protein
MLRRASNLSNVLGLYVRPGSFEVFKATRGVHAVQMPNIMEHVERKLKSKYVQTIAEKTPKHT